MPPFLPNIHRRPGSRGSIGNPLSPFPSFGGYTVVPAVPVNRGLSPALSNSRHVTPSTAQIEAVVAGLSQTPPVFYRRIRSVAEEPNREFIESTEAKVYQPNHDKAGSTTSLDSSSPEIIKITGKKIATP